MPEFRSRPPRQYPPFFEKIIPITLGVLVLVMFLLLLVAIGVLVGWIG
ncbi:MAG: hypothetical protein ANABAC_3436 [Anaerolineae bacterium]|nr:MAG: hypothetical protein ANABAC_3436 [Anaerolineae bacterium]